jgi:hypothetical protein
MTQSLKTLQLLFEENLPYPAKSCVCLGGSYGVAKDGEPLLTPDCIDARELEHYIELLKRDLDEIKVKARKRFVAYEKKIEQHFNDKSLER